MTHEPYGFHAFVVPEDGNCLFQAFCFGAEFVGGAIGLRQCVVENNTAHPDLEWHGATFHSQQEKVVAESKSF